MGFFNELDIDVSDMVAEGATRDEVLSRFPFLTEAELDVYFEREYDYSGDDEEYDTDDEDYVVGYDDLISEPEWVDGDEY